MRTICFLRWTRLKIHVFRKCSSLVMMCFKRQALQHTLLPLALWPRVLEVRSCGWGYLQLREREKWFLFLIHTFSLDHCLLIMPPILHRVGVAPLPSDERRHPHRRGRGMCKTCAFPGAARWAAARSAARGPRSVLGWVKRLLEKQRSPTGPEEFWVD